MKQRERAMDLPLGRSISLPKRYAPQILCPVPRVRAQFPAGAALPFTGEDIWRAWELSWCDDRGRPRAAAARFFFPCDTPALIESKSLKLYLHSLNSHRLASAAAAAALLRQDLSAAAGAQVAVELCALAELPSHPDWQPQLGSGECLDELEVAAAATGPEPQHLAAGGRERQELLCSRLFRSLCPVTGQPDWGEVYIRYRGAAINRRGLLAYLLSFRQHPDFHESCAERVFLDLLAHCRPRALAVAIAYLRRGGLDITPWRALPGEPAFRPPRIFRQ